MDVKKWLKNNELVIGYGVDFFTQDIKKVINGKLLFKLMDSHGLPFWFIQEELLQKANIAFDIRGFIQEAIKSKNYSAEKLYNRLTEDIDITFADKNYSKEKVIELREKIKETIDYLYNINIGK